MVAVHDKTTDPKLQEQLLQARRGTAFFARKLNELSDEELGEGTRLKGWTRRHIVAHVGYNARALARLVEWAATGVETPMYSSHEARNHEIDFGATLTPTALRNLFEHSAVHLSVEWRDLPATDWVNRVKTIQNRTVPVAETVWMRTREVWIHAVDLNNGASFSDIPSVILERVLGDITQAWNSRGTDVGLLIKVTGTDLKFGHTTAVDPVTVTGSLAATAAWASGRGSNGIKAWALGAAVEIPTAPRWV